MVYVKQLMNECRDLVDGAKPRTDEFYSTFNDEMKKLVNGERVDTSIMNARIQYIIDQLNAAKDKISEVSEYYAATDQRVTPSNDC